MIKDKTYKLIVALLAIIFAAALFFSVRFLKAKITAATTSGQGEAASTFNIEDWNKIKHHFTP